MHEIQVVEDMSCYTESWPHESVLCCLSSEDTFISTFHYQELLLLPMELQAVLPQIKPI